MLPDIETLRANPEKYQLILVLQHREIGDFVRYYFYCNTPLSSFFRKFLILILIFFLSVLTYKLIQSPENWGYYLLQFGVGLVGFFLLVPFHELIHGFMYKFYGAPRVRYGVFWSKLAFYALAPEFVISKKEFIPLATATFIIINSLLILALFFSWQDSAWHFTIWGAFLMHSLGCMGDFALIGFFEKQGKRKIYTFDASNAESSFFYEDISNEG